MSCTGRDNHHALRVFQICPQRFIMKHLFALVLLFPLSACTIENDYYGNGYYGPQSQIEGPYGYSYREAPRTHYHNSEQSSAYRHSMRHGHRNYTPYSGGDYYRDGNVHGHDNGASGYGNNIHGHD